MKTSRASSLLDRVQAGDHQAADALMELVYDELRGLAQSLLNQDAGDHTLQATALVNEAYLRMLGQAHVAWKGQAHFRAIAARMIRRVLVDHLRARRTVKRGGDVPRWTLHESAELLESRSPACDVLELHEALERLEQLNPRQARVVELRFFAGFDVEETAAILDVSDRTVKDDWRFAKAWLKNQLSDESEP